MTSHAAQLTTTEVADLLEVPERNLAASITKQWWTYIEGQPARVADGLPGRSPGSRVRRFAPIDVVVIEMLYRTGQVIRADELDNTLENVREYFADELYQAARSDQRPDLLATMVGDGSIEIVMAPAWFLLDRAVAKAEESADA